LNDALLSNAKILAHDEIKEDQWTRDTEFSSLGHCTIPLALRVQEIISAGKCPPPHRRAIGLFYTPPTKYTLTAP
jgi:hypothetical protein